MGGQFSWSVELFRNGRETQADHFRIKGDAIGSSAMHPYIVQHRNLPFVLIYDPSGKVGVYHVNGYEYFQGCPSAGAVFDHETGPCRTTLSACRLVVVIERGFGVLLEPDLVNFMVNGRSSAVALGRSSRESINIDGLLVIKRFRALDGTYLKDKDSHIYLPLNRVSHIKRATPSSMLLAITAVAVSLL